MKIKVNADDPKDHNIADQMTTLLNWKIVESKSDSHPDFGYPMGQILCRSLSDAEEHIEKSEFKDCFIRDYLK